MIKLSELKNTHRKKVKVQRVGRGIGSGRGKMCGRGMKGMKSRSGYKKRHGAEGGQRPVFRKIPIRGFTRGRWLKDEIALNVAILDRYFEDGEVVSLQALKDKSLISKKKNPVVKVLGFGELTKKLTVEVNAVSKSAEEKIVGAKGVVKLVQ